MSNRSRASLPGVRAQVIRQHAELRARLHGLDRVAATATSPLATRHLRALLFGLARSFDAHLAFEERELATRLSELPDGELRVTAMVDEHREQRAELERATAVADDQPLDSTELRGEVRWLVMRLLEDMNREEAELLALDALGTAPGAERRTA